MKPNLFVDSFTSRDGGINKEERGNSRMSKRPHLTLISAVLLPVLLFCIAVPPGVPEKTIDEMADGIIRASRFNGAKQAYLPIIRKRTTPPICYRCRTATYYAFGSQGEEGSSGVSIAMSRLVRGSSQWSYPVILSIIQAGRTKILYRSELRTENSGCFIHRSRPERVKRRHRV